MLIVFVLVLGGAVLLFVTYPLWRGPAEADTAPDRTALRDLLSRKEVLLATVRELDFDLQTGKLSPADHRDLRARCKGEAVGVMDRLEQLGSSHRASARAMEEEIARPRRAREGAGRRVDEDVRFCLHCGHSPRPADRFCTRCGSRLKA